MSVLIPCYNCSLTLPNTLTSCLQQTFDSFEVILVDDCSQDDVKKIFDVFLPKFLRRNIPLRYYRSRVNLGVSFSRNLAWDCAKGKYICFLDSDDIWHQDKLCIVSNFLNTHDCDVLCHGYTTKKNDFHGPISVNDYEMSRLTVFNLLLKNPSQTSCFALRRSIGQRFDNSMSYCEDYDLWLRISSSCTFYQIRGKPMTLLSRPQKTPGGLSENRTRMRVGEMKAYGNFLRNSNTLIFFLPVLFVFSALKHVRSEFRYTVHHASSITSSVYKVVVKCLSRIIK